MMALHFSIIIIIIIVVVGMKLRALLLLGKHPTTALPPNPELALCAAVITVITVTVPASRLHLDV